MCVFGALADVITRKSKSLNCFISTSVTILTVSDGCGVSGPHTMSFPWQYRTVSAGREIVGCQTIIAEPDDDGNGEVGTLLCGVQSKIKSYVMQGTNLG